MLGQNLEGVFVKHEAEEGVQPAQGKELEE